MSHTSQRRGLTLGKEMIVLAMVPSAYADNDRAGKALSELAVKMLEHRPDNWMSRNFTEITIPDIGPAQPAVEWAHKNWPYRTERLLMNLVGRMSTVVTAVFTDMEKVNSLIADLKGEWLQKNREAGAPVSVVLTGLFEDVHSSCETVGNTPHTYLHSLGFRGKVEELPGPLELEIMTMCGHGLVAMNRVRYLRERIEKGRMTAREAAEDIAKPCVCGIVNIERAEEIFEKMTR